MKDDPQNSFPSPDEPSHGAVFGTPFEPLGFDPDVHVVAAVDPESQGPNRIGPTGHPVIAWCVVLLVVALIIGASSLKREEPVTEVDPAALVILEIQSKYLIGAAELFDMPGRMALEQAEVFDNGPLRNRLCFVTLSGELGGADVALKRLRELFRPVGDFGREAISDTDRLIERNLSVLYQDLAAERWNAPTLTAEQRQQLRSELRWFGQLALAPRQGDSAARSDLVAQSRRVVFVVLTAAILAMGMGFVGLFALPTMCILVVMRVIAPRLRPSRHGGLYAETFAVWMLVFLGAGLVIELLAEDQLSLNLVGFVVSGSALAWPVLRGIPWRTVRREVGLYAGRRWYLEPVYGLVCYVCTLPLVALALLFILLAMQAGGLPLAEVDLNPTELPTHPIIEWVQNAGPWGRFQILMIACCAAPILEETMFRGVLYRHLRDATAGWKMGISVVISVGVNS
ncbi:MAG: CPBP family glutamic-type intramembrane protease, partial [Planctomycetaceae bacterium]